MPNLVQIHPQGQGLRGLSGANAGTVVPECDHTLAWYCQCFKDDNASQPKIAVSICESRTAVVVSWTARSNDFTQAYLVVVPTDSRLLR